MAYGAFKAAEDVYAVSYLSAAGYTLTVVLNLKNQQLVGFASGEKMWEPVRARSRCDDALARNGFST